MSGVSRELPELADRYTLEREIGRGATATVFLARDTQDDRDVAIKMLRPEYAQSHVAQMFLREIRHTSALVHPRILPVLDAGESAGRLYFVLPYMEEGTLRQRMQREPQLPLTEAVAIARTLAETLHQAHLQGLVHRDVKPENVLFSHGQAYLADFGIARALEKTMDNTSTSAGIVRGTVAYMSPEQASGGRDIDGRSDVFSLGCVFYEMLAGVPAFIGPNPEVILAQRFTHVPRDIGVYRPSVPVALRELVMQALAIAPADRFRTADEMVRALDALGPPIDGEGAYRPVRGFVRQWARSPLARGVAVAAVLGAGVFAWQAARPDNVTLEERDWVLVADFEGPEGDRALPVTVRELVTAELNQSRFVGTVTRQQLNAEMRLAGVPETTHVNADLARQLAVRTSIRAIVAGSIQRLGPQRYSVAIHVVSADSGRNLYSVSTSSEEGGLVIAIDSLARDLRRRLGERPEAIATTLPLMEAATPSFQAYQKYIAGVVELQSGNVQQSTALLHEAVKLDTAFASAYAALGANFLGARMTDSAQAYFDRAMSFPGRLTNAQKYRLQGDIAYSIRHDISAAARWYDLYVAELPRAIGGRNNRALYQAAAGKYDAAIQDLRDAIAANPFGPERIQVNLFNLAAMLASVGRVDEARAATTDLKDPFLPGARLLISAAASDWPAVSTHATEIGTLKTSPALVSLLGATGRAAALAAQGSIVSAESELRRARDASSGSTARFHERSALLLSIATGRPPIPASAGRADSSAGAALVRALRAAMLRDTVAASRELRVAVADTASARALLGHGPAVVRGWIAAAGGRWSDVTSALAATSLAGEHDATILDRFSSLEIRWLVATAYEAQGKPDSAVVHLKLVVSPLRVPAGHLAMGGLLLPLALDRLATLYARLGDRVAATGQWRQVLAQVKQPEAEAAAVLQRAQAGLAAHGTSP
jgi:serine/threonine-protein kinase